MLVQSMRIARSFDPLDPLETEAALAEMTSAIATMYFEDVRDLDIRHLWSREGLHYFRVNWWCELRDAGPRVRRSAFVCVEHDAAGYRITDATRREAA